MDFERKTIQISRMADSLWLPVYTKPQHEFRLLKYLEERNIPAYLPVVPDIKVHNIRKGDNRYTYKKEVLRPMFGSYLFACLGEEEKRNIWRSDSVIRVWTMLPEAQEQFLEELRGVQMMEELAQNTKLEFRSDIQVNDRFMIESPPYEGTYGYLVEKRKRFLWVIKIDMMNVAVQAEIDPSMVKLRKVE